METKNKYFLLRHGQTIYQKENRNLIYSDDEYFSLEITEEGRKRIKEQAEELENKKIDLIFSSPLLRAKQSAEIISNVLNLPVAYDKRLIDMKMGELAGKQTSIFKDFFVNKKLGLLSRPKGGENWVDILERMTDFLDDIENKYEDKNILIISHGEPLWLLAAYLNGAKTVDEFLVTRKKEKLYPLTGDLIEI